MLAHLYYYFFIGYKFVVFDSMSYFPFDIILQEQLEQIANDDPARTPQHICHILDLFKQI